MEKIAVCAIFKDEAPYLLEWIAFHRIIGVDLFVMYDNGSSDGGAELIRQSSFAKSVTILDWHDRPGQLSAYQHFHTTYAEAFSWVAFIDIDEFIMPVGTGSIRGILLREAYKPYADILLNWQIFGPSGHVARPNGLVVENFTQRFPEDAEANRHVKSLVRTQHLLRVGGTPHIFDCTRPTCNARGETVTSHAMQPAVCSDVMVINHYFTKSAEEWAFKRQRGRGDSLDPYGDRVFTDVEAQAMVEDVRARRFLPRLRALLES
jgi:Glycosyltransferase family 92